MNKVKFFSFSLSLYHPLIAIKMYGNLCTHIIYIFIHSHTHHNVILTSLTAFWFIIYKFFFTIIIFIFIRNSARSHFIHTQKNYTIEIFFTKIFPLATKNVIMFLSLSHSMWHIVKFVFFGSCFLPSCMYILRVLWQGAYRASSMVI
jgi:hypothetical protein